MLISRRRSAAGATALALAALVLTACSEGGAQNRADTSAPAAVTTPATSTASTTATASVSVSVSASASASAAAPTTAPDPTAAAGAPGRWADTKQFMQITDAWISDGRTYLSVRTARKQPATGDIEAWLIIPGRGPYSTVSMATGSRILLSVPLGDNSVPYPYSQAEFVRRMKRQSPTFLEGLGFDLTFDGNGRVTRLQSLYTP
ncbi:hypothetical protein AB0N87_00590 [Streptomyces sp. NPDC093228]|jgi:hypothetical protein|uniref:hypothetical protein n=1 Tax=unclassified Streptomyces TaxID=2593676 RepID=UPI0007412820|nr:MULTISPECIES: hypothetical protein [unclassified Streptomyces]KUJ53644.1 hypothetical protein ADL25_08255 [Streptomyces sp. NRRL F-5122]MDX3262235.1 hypothetical protein [Streptomyces sp. MI02-2A]REE61726.1 hypothetical protein BX257_4311 [Streptomyces sp. 3212.3]